MAYTVSATINVLPSIGQSVRIYGQAINTSTDELTAATILTAEVLQGNVAINQTGGETYFIANDISPIALLLTMTETGTDRYVFILYTNAIYAQQIPDNFARLIQKIPLGIFNDLSKESIIGQLMKAKAMMIDDYYQKYFELQNQVYSNDYSPALEFEYNGTTGLLSNSAFPNELFRLFSSMGIYGLNAYDLELLISQYIYFRIGIECPVYIVNDANPTQNYWTIGEPGFDELDATPPQTVIAPDSYNPALTNIGWTIYNCSSFTTNFKTELTNFVLRMSRCDIGNVITYSNIVDPTTDGFTLIGPTYPGDPRLIYGKCLKYTDASSYPLNLIGYVKP